MTTRDETHGYRSAASGGGRLRRRALPTEACEAPEGAVENDKDCDDTDTLTNPSASESCNGPDDDCDGKTDDGVTLVFFPDEDGDGYGNPAAPV